MGEAEGEKGRERERPHLSSLFAPPHSPSFCLASYCHRKPKPLFPVFLLFDVFLVSEMPAEEATLIHTLGARGFFRALVGLLPQADDCTAKAHERSGTHSFIVW